MQCKSIGVNRIVSNKIVYQIDNINTCEEEMVSGFKSSSSCSSSKIILLCEIISHQISVFGEISVSYFELVIS